METATKRQQQSGRRNKTATEQNRRKEGTLEEKRVSVENYSDNRELFYTVLVELQVHRLLQKHIE